MASSTGDNGSRPFSSRSRSAGRFARQQERQKASIDEQKFDEEIQLLSEGLNVRVRERDPTDERPRSRLGSLKFKSGNESSGGPSASLEQKANELKGTLSSLFRRSQSTDRSPAQQGMQSSRPVSDLVNSPQSTVPTLSLGQSHQTPRGPFTGNQQIGLGRPPTTAANRGPAGNVVANGGTHGAGTTNVTTTAIRPFSGFPGKRGAATTDHQKQTVEQSSASGIQSSSGQFETDLSEMASIAPHINMRRISAIASDPSSLFLNRTGGHQHPQSSAQTSRGSARKNGAGEIDVNFLSRFLCPEDEIQDEQIHWTWDSLFASVTSELREEWALEEEANNNDGAAGVVEMGPAGGMVVQQQPQHQQRGF